MAFAGNNSNSFAAPAAQFIEALAGFQQHDEHCRGWRWHMYCQDDKHRMAAVNEAVRKLIAARRRPLFAEAV